MLFRSEAGGVSHLGTILLSAVSKIWRFCMVICSLLPISLETTHDPKEPVLLIAFKIMRHAKLCLSVIMFLIVRFILKHKADLLRTSLMTQMTAEVAILMYDDESWTELLNLKLGNFAEGVN